MTKMPIYFIVTVDKILLCVGVQKCTSTLANPNFNPNLSLNPNLNLKLTLTLTLSLVSPS